MTRRPREAMPADVAAAIAPAALKAAYAARPPYQRNDYLRWIGSAKRDETRRRRIARMVAELRDGGVYMGRKWTGRTA